MDRDKRRLLFGFACGLLLCAVCVLAIREVPAPLTPAVARPTLSGYEAHGSLCLNTATAEELMTLPELGPVLAARILDYRERHHGIDSLDELLQVEGVGEQRVALWQAYVYIGVWEETA